MSPRTTSGPRRYKLRVNFVGLDAYDRDENVLPYRKLIYIAYENESIRNVCEGINTLFAKLYPEDGHNKVVRLRDSFMCDVSDDFIVSDVFDESPEVYAAMKGLSVSDDLPESALLSTSNDHQRIAVRPKRKRYTLTPCRDMVPLLIDRRESMPLEVAARNGCSPDGIVESTDGSKRLRLDSSSSKMTNQRRYGTESPELGSSGDKHEFTNVLVSTATSAAALGITSRTNVIKNSLSGTSRPGIWINRDSHVFSAIAPSYISGIGLDIAEGTPNSEAMSPELGQHIYQLQNPHPEAELSPSVDEEPSSEQADGVGSRDDNEPSAHNTTATSPPTTRSSARIAKNQTKDLVSTTPAASKLTEKAAIKPEPELEADADSDSTQMDAESVAPTSTANTEIAAAAASATPSSDVIGEGEESSETESSDGSDMEVDDDNVKFKADAEADESSDEASGSDDEEESSDDEAAEEDIVKTEPGVEAEESSEEEEEEEEEDESSEEDADKITVKIEPGTEVEVEEGESDEGSDEESNGEEEADVAVVKTEPNVEEEEEGESSEDEDSGDEEASSDEEADEFIVKAEPGAEEEQGEEEESEEEEASGDSEVVVVKVEPAANIVSVADAKANEDEAESSDEESGSASESNSGESDDYSDSDGDTESETESELRASVKSKVASSAGASDDKDAISVIKDKLTEHMSVAAPQTPVQSKQRPPALDASKFSTPSKKLDSAVPDTPISPSRRKIHLRKPLAVENESDSSDSDSDSDSQPRKLAKLPILGTPITVRRISGVLELAKTQRVGVGREGSGIMSISQMAKEKPYDEMRKKMAKIAATRVTSSLQSTPAASAKATPQQTREPSPENESDSDSSSSSNSDSNSEPDSDSSSDDDDDDNVKNGGRANGKNVTIKAPESSQSMQRRPIRFAGANSLTTSAKARRRKSALLNM